MCDPDRAAYPEPRPGRGSGCAPRGEVGNLPFISPGGSSCSLRPDRLLSLIQAHTGGIAPASRQLPDFFGELLTPDLCGFGIDITPDAFAPCCWAATSDPIHS